MTNLAPVAVFAFNRADHLRKTLDALARCPESVATDVHVFADGPRGPQDLDKVAAVAGVLDEFSKRTNFARFRVSRSLSNKGLARSVIDGVSSLVEEHGRVIVLEDDIIVTRHFLASMNNGLRDLEFRKDIWSISGYSPPISIPTNYPYQAYLTNRSSSWGWATWADRWRKGEWERSTFEQLANSQKFRRQFSLGGLDLPVILDAYIAGDASSWAVRWCAIQSREGGMTSYPTRSLVTNLGTDGSGTNSPISNKYNPVVSSARVDLADIPADPNPKIQTTFRRFHLSRTRFYGSILKKAARRMVRKIK